LPGLVTVTVLPPPPPPTIACDIRQSLTSLDHVVCIANEPVENATLADASAPEVSHAHLSPFSSPLLSVQPPAGFWSVIVSAYSCPSTIVTPSSVPELPEFTKPCPQVLPASVTYGMLVNAMSPTLDETGPPGSVESPFQSCHAQNWPLDVLNPSGLVPCGDTMTYWALRFAAAVVLPKCVAAAASACWPSWCPVAWVGDAEPVSAQTPASVPPPVGYATCAEFAGQVCDPLAMPSQYWVITPDHSSLMPRPLNSCWSRGAIPTESPVNVVLPLPSVPALPHWEP
jgi:hypothetical protein